MRTGPFGKADAWLCIAHFPAEQCLLELGKKCSGRPRLREGEAPAEPEPSINPGLTSDSTQRLGRSLALPDTFGHAHTTLSACSASNFFSISSVSSLLRGTT